MAKRSNAEVIKIFVTPWTFSVGLGFFSIVVSFLTGWYPSKRAVKIDPLDALKYE
jgi:ABC-type antimicrobial peptide transport system permease subunit